MFIMLASRHMKVWQYSYMNHWQIHFGLPGERQVHGCVLPLNFANRGREWKHISYTSNNIR